METRGKCQLSCTKVVTRAFRGFRWGTPQALHPDFCDLELKELFLNWKQLIQIGFGQWELYLKSLHLFSIKKGYAKDGYMKSVPDPIFPVHSKEPQLFGENVTIAFFGSPKLDDTVDGAEIPNNHLLDVYNPINNGKDYQPQLGCRISEPSTVPLKLPHFCPQKVRSSLGIMPFRLESQNSAADCLDDKNHQFLNSEMVGKTWLHNSGWWLQNLFIWFLLKPFCQI